MDEYIDRSVEMYRRMLENEGLEEHAFQHFFEENPAFIPGAFELMGHSGHDPYLGSLISQPRIGKSLRRFPDFLWLANDSLSFCPVFIEIERPSKTQFRENDVPYAKFNQAMDQIIEWKALLDDNSNRLFFFDSFAIPERLREMVFAPQYLLIYGRSTEYETISFRRSKRFHMQKEDIKIKSFDSLWPSRDNYSLVTSVVHNGIYNVRNIPPTFVYEPIRAKNLHLLHGFKDQIKHMKMISEERRRFLLKRYDYWEEFGKQRDQGLFRPSDKE